MRINVSWCTVPLEGERGRLTLSESPWSATRDCPFVLERWKGAWIHAFYTKPCSACLFCTDARVCLCAKIESRMKKKRHLHSYRHSTTPSLNLFNASSYLAGL